MNQDKERSSNYLTHQKMFRLAEWLRSNMESLHGLTYKQIAEKASDGVGFSVTVSNIYGAERAAEITLPIASRVAEPTEKELTMKERIARLEADFVTLWGLFQELQHKPDELPVPQTENLDQAANPF